MYLAKGVNFFWCTLVTLCMLSYGVSSWEYCPKYIPHYCACEITDQPAPSLLNMCTYEVLAGVGCKPCPPYLQDYANCTSCPGKTCPVCAPDEFDMQALQRSVSLDTFEDLKGIGHIATSFSFMLAQNSRLIYTTGGDQSTGTDSDTGVDQNKYEQKFSDGNQTSRISNISNEDSYRSGIQFSDENITEWSSDITDEQQNTNGQQLFDGKQTTKSKNVSEDESISDLESLEQDETTTDQYFSGENYGSEKENYTNKIKEKGRSTQDYPSQLPKDKDSLDQQFETETNSNNSFDGNENDEIVTKDEIEGSTLKTEKDSGVPGKYISGMTEESLGLNSSITDEQLLLETASSKSFVSDHEITDTAQSDKSQKQSTKTGTVAEDPIKDYVSDDENLNLDNEIINVKVWFSGERYPQERIMPDVEIIEDNKDKMIETNQSVSSFPDQAYEQPYLQTEMPNEGLRDEKKHAQQDIKPSDAQRFLKEKGEASDSFEFTSSSTSVPEMLKYSDDSFVAGTVQGKKLNPIAFTLSSSPEEVVFLRGESSKNDSFSDKIFPNHFEDEFQFENISSVLENNNSRYASNNEKNGKISTEKDSSKLRLTHLTTETGDQVIFSKNDYVKDVINHEFFYENNSVIQTLAFDVMFVNYLKYTKGMPDLTNFYFIANYSLEKEVDVNLVRICFLNEKYFSVTDDEINLCRKEISIPESSFLLTVRVQNSHIPKNYEYEPFEDSVERGVDEEEHRDENQTLSDGRSLPTNERQRTRSKAYEYMFLKNEAKKFVRDSFDFRKRRTLWETSENDTFRFCHDANLVRVCKNYEDGTRIHMKIDNRFRIFISAYLNSMNLIDMHVSEFMKMQHLMSNTNAESERKKETHKNKESNDFPYAGFSDIFYGEIPSDVGDNETLNVLEDGSGGNSMNLTEEYEYDHQNETIFISYSEANMSLSRNRSLILEVMNPSTSVDSTTSNFSDETGDTEEVSLTSINDTNEEESSEMGRPLTGDIADYKSGLEQDIGSARLRRATNSTKHSLDDWCSYTMRTYNGSITCKRWTYKKECTVDCYPGYDYAGVKSKQFICERKENVWVPELASCQKGSGYTNINEALGYEDHSNENMESRKEAKNQKAAASEQASTGNNDKGDDLLSNYHPSEFNFDNYAYDKFNYDSLGDEYE